MRRAVKRALVAAVGLVPVGAEAATYDFNFSTTDSVFSVTAAITTADTLDAVGGYDVLSISGTISGPGGGTIALTQNPSQPFADPTVTFTYDNVYFVGAGPQVDENGILFSAGGYHYNLFSLGPTTYYLSSDNPAGVYIPGEPVTFGEPVRIATATSAPEPSTWALMLLGFVGLGLAARQARRRETTPDLRAPGAAQRA
jgi:PEP-CTERM motif